LTFVDAETGDITSEADHPMCTQVLWDPTGRYLATVTDNQRIENGYRLWSFHGTELLEERKQSLYQFAWRPRPKGLLPKDKLESLKTPKLLKQYRTKFRKEDRSTRDENLLKKLAEKREIRNNYAQFVLSQAEVLERDNERLKALGIDIEGGENQEYEFQTISSKQFFLE